MRVTLIKKTTERSDKEQSTFKVLKMKEVLCFSNL